MRKLKIVSKIILLISVLVTLLLFRIGFHIYEYLGTTFIASLERNYFQEQIFLPVECLNPRIEKCGCGWPKQLPGNLDEFRFVLDHGVHHNDVSLDNSICHSGEDI